VTLEMQESAGLPQSLEAIVPAAAHAFAASLAIVAL
jgi:hypothetical protein